MKKIVGDFGVGIQRKNELHCLNLIQVLNYLFDPKFMGKDC